MVKNKKLSQVRFTLSPLSQRRGWIRVVEAFFAVLLMGGVILIFVNQNSGDTNDTSAEIYNKEITILRTIQLNDSLRASVLEIDNSVLPLELNDSGFPANVKSRIEGKIPAYLTCGAKICKVEQECIPISFSSSDVYVNSITIFANLQINNPRKLVLSCSLKQ